MRIVNYITCLAGLMAHPALAATPASTTMAAEDGGVEPILVTALRTPLAPEQVAASVTVLDERKIEQEQPLAVSDILIRTPGVSFTRSGGYGTSTALKIRGADSGHTTLVIDGMRLADASSSSGGYNFANLMLGDVRQIEILRGPQSILWGSDAIGGVVNIVSARPRAALDGSMDIEAGSRGTVSARAGIGGTGKYVDWRLAGSTFTTDGISAIAAGTEPDGFVNRNGSGRLTVHLSNTLSADIRGYYTAARNDYDASSVDAPVYGETEEWSAYAGLNLDLLAGRLHNRFAYMRNETDRENYDPRRTIRRITFDARGKTNRWEYQGSLELTQAWSLIFGTEREENSIYSASPANSNAPVVPLLAQADINSLYAQLRVSPLRGLTLSGGARRDDHSRFGSNLVMSGNALWSLGKSGTRLRASYDEGFKAPSLYQLFSSYGVASLQPEEAKGWEAGVEQPLFGEHVKLSATYYERETRNLIDFIFCPTSGTLPAECYIPGTATTRSGYYANVRRSQAQGIELGGSAALGQLRIDGNYSWVRARDLSAGPNYGNQLARTPRQLANASVNYAWGFGLSTGLALRYSGKTIDRAQSSAAVPPDMLGAYALVDLRAEYRVSPQLGLYARVENLFDKSYQTARGYGALGRSVYAGIRGRF